MDLRWFSKHDPLPNDKWDFNTATFGGNLPGASWEWPEASYDRRAEIAKEIENYHRGLLHFLATDPRVPEKVQNRHGALRLADATSSPTTAAGRIRFTSAKAAAWSAIWS